MSRTERKKELYRRRGRRAKLRKLKGRLENLTGKIERRNVIAKIRRISPDALPRDFE
ncbi:MAG: DUF6800 family protein [Pirellulales bacterium]